MITVTPKRIALIVWLIENTGKDVSVLQATKEVGLLNYKAVYAALKDLERGGYIRRTKTKRYQVVDAPALIRQIALSIPFRAKAIVGFFVGGDTAQKMRELVGIDHDVVFTLFAAAELLSPYVRTNAAHAYIRAGSINRLSERLLNAGARRSEGSESDLFILPTESAYVFRFSRTRGDFKIAPMGILLADLQSYGGLGQEQADRIMREWLSGLSA